MSRRQPQPEPPIYVVAPMSEVARDALRDVSEDRWKYVSVERQVQNVGPGDRFLILGAPTDLHDCQRTTAAWLREVSGAEEIMLHDIEPDHRRDVAS